MILWFFIIIVSLELLLHGQCYLSSWNGQRTFVQDSLCDNKSLLFYSFLENNKIQTEIKEKHKFRMTDLW